MYNLKIVKMISDKNKSMIYEVLAHPTLIESGLKAPVDLELPRTNKIVFTGIGTSGLTGEFMKIYFESKGYDARIRVYRHQDVPIDDESIYIIYSYSGTTLETLRTLMKLHEAGKTPLVFSTDGYLEKYALKYKLPFFKIRVPQIENVEKLETRSHLPLGITYFSRIFSKILGSEDEVTHELREGLSHIKSFISRLDEKIDSFKDIAGKIINAKIPIISADYATAILARRFRNQLCENSKRVTMWDVFPEMGHNLLCSLKEEESNVLIIAFRRKDADPITRKYYEILLELFNEGQNLIFIDLEEEKYSWGMLFEGIFIGDLISILVGDYLGRETKPIHQVDIVKKKLREVVRVDRL